METQATGEAARLLAEARLGRRRFAGLPDGRRPVDEAEAYAIQEALHRRLEAAGRGPVVGYKIGCTTPVMQRFLGIDSPCAGGMLRPGVRQRDGRFRHADFLRVGVECEIAVSLARDLPEGAPYDRYSVGEAIGTCGWHGGPAADGTAEIGYGLSAAYRGHGYGRESVAAMVGWRPFKLPFRVLVQYTHRNEEAGASYANDSVDAMLHAVW